MLDFVIRSSKREDPELASISRAARRDPLLWDEVRPYLIEERARIELSSFGTWVEMMAFIGKRLRELWNDVGKASTTNGEPVVLAARRRLERPAPKSLRL